VSIDLFIARDVVVLCACIVAITVSMVSGLIGYGIIDLHDVANYEIESSSVTPASIKPE
jgi:hypothetical protein